MIRLIKDKESLTDKMLHLQQIKGVINCLQKVRHVFDFKILKTEYHIFQIIRSWHHLWKKCFLAYNCIACVVNFFY